MSTTDVDCLVIGGGVTGCALAYYLAGEGAQRVALLERGELNSGASGGNAGSLHVQMLSHFARMAQPREMADAERPLALHLAGVEEWRRLSHDLQDDFQLHVGGGLMVAENPQEVAMLEAKALRERRHGIEVELLGGAQARARAPYLGASVQALAWCPSEGKVNPLLGTPALARAATRFGAKIFRNAALLSLRREPQGSLAESAAGRFRARTVVNAAGPGAGTVAALLGIEMPIGIRPMQMSVTEAAPPLIAHLVQHAGRRLTLMQAHSGNILIGGGWPAGVDEDGHSHLLRKSIEGNMAVACRIVPQLAGLHLLRSWTATNARVPDGNPLLGEMPGEPGFFFAVSVPNGYTLGPICARLVAQSIMGRATGFNLASWSPGRFAAARQEQAPAHSTKGSPWTETV